MHLRNSKYPLHLSLFFFSKNKIFSLKTLSFSFCFFFLKKARAKQSVSPTHFCSQRGNFHSQVLKSRDQKIKWNGQGDLKSSCHIFSPGVFNMFLVKKRLCKTKYSSEGTISNVDLGLFYPNNQLMFSFVTFWFC